LTFDPKDSKKQNKTKQNKTNKHGPLFSLQLSQEQGLILIYNEYEKS